MNITLFASIMVDALLTPAPDPHEIVQGIDASTCQWPSVVALRDAGGNQFCTGTLVHPRLVITAGHCVEPTTGLSPATVAFGEDAADPAGIAAVERCAWHPEYALMTTPGVQEVSNDVAYCVLTAPADGLPIVPVAIGCESEAARPDAPASIVGFGASAGGIMGGQPWAEGTGHKRWTEQTIASIDAENAKAIVVGDAGNSACLGDSGGPLFLQLDDGTWRLFGVASAAMLDAAQECGAGAIYQLVSPHVAWIANDADIDLGSCFDGEGAWAPDESCGGFPTAPASSDSEWARGCATNERGGASATCGAPFDAGTSDGGSSSTGADSTEGGVDLTSGTSGDSEGDTSGDADDGTSSGAPSETNQREDQGCACSASARCDGNAFALLVMLVLGGARCRATRVRLDRDNRDNRGNRHNDALARVYSGGYAVCRHAHSDASSRRVHRSSVRG